MKTRFIAINRKSMLVTIPALVLVAVAATLLIPGGDGDIRPVGAYSVAAPAEGQAVIGPAIPTAAIGPDKIHFNGVLIDSTTGNPAPQGAYAMTFSIWDSLTGGTKLFEEPQTVQVKKSGVFNTFLGSTVAFPPGMFETGSLFVEIKVASDPPMTPRQELVKVPRALFSDKADKANQSSKAEKADKAETVSQPGFLVTALDTTGFLPDGTSATIGTDGLPLISYHGSTLTEGLKVAHCVDVACTSATTNTVDSGSGVGKGSSMTIGVDGLPIVSYTAGGALKVAHCNDALCSLATTSTFSGSTDRTSITIGADGLPLIVYGPGSVNVLRCGDVACTPGSGESIKPIDPGEVGSVTVGTDGHAIVSYRQSSNLKVTYCLDEACGLQTQTTLVTGSVTEVGAVTVGGDGLAVIAYAITDISGQTLKAAHCDNTVCTSATVTAVGAGVLDSNGSATTGVDGAVLIGYHDQSSGNLMVARCNNAACTGMTTVPVELSPASTGLDSSMTVGADGLPLIAYFDDTNDDLQVAHCSNRFCVPNHRSR